MDWASVDGYAAIYSDLGGYQELWSGPTLLEGPGWEGVTELRIRVDSIGGPAYLDADDFMVRM